MVYCKIVIYVTPQHTQYLYMRIQIHVFSQVNMHSHLKCEFDIVVALGHKISGL